MKIDKISDTDYKLYIYSWKIKKDNISESVKEIIKKLQKKLKLSGFYRIVVCLKNCGLFLQLIKLEDSFYKNTLDLRIVIDNDLDVYFKTDDYFRLNKDNSIRFYDNNYYVVVDDSFELLNDNVEFGEFIFGNECDELLCNSIII